VSAVGGDGHVGGAPTLVIADDHPAFRLGVRIACTRGGFDVVAEAGDGEGAFAAVSRECPDVCLLDVRMPGGGIEAARRISEAALPTSVVMLTVSDHAEDVLSALRAGAVGYLPKDTSPTRLPAALCGVLKGEAALPRALVGLVVSRFRDSTAGLRSSASRTAAPRFARSRRCASRSVVQASPFRTAKTAAWTRLCAPSFWRMFVT
jgi:DNA-binding NarL/FixJ family response regulator